MKMIFRDMRVAVLICSFLLLLESAEAAQINFHPRVYTGIMDYSIKYSALSKSTPSTPGQFTGANETGNDSTDADTMYFSGGGATLSINRFYIDLSGQYAYGGNSTSQSTWSSYIQRKDDLTKITSATFFSRTRFDHSDSTVAVGYAIRRDLSAFVGYKWADTHFKETSDTKIDSYYPYLLAISESLMTIRRDAHFKYEGPFIGIKRGFEIERFRYLKGVASIKLALAYLNSKYIRLQHVRTQDLFDDEVETWWDNDVAKGDSWGFSFGLGWRGNTPISNLTYALNIDGYRYHFNHDHQYIRKISETVLQYKFDLSYSF